MYISKKQRVGQRDGVLNVKSMSQYWLILMSERNFLLVISPHSSVNPGKNEANSCQLRQGRTMNSPHFFAERDRDSGDHRTGRPCQL